MPYGTQPFHPREERGAAAAARSYLEQLIGRLVDRYVVDKLYSIIPIDLSANRTQKIETGQQKASLAYISVYSGTLDLYNGEVSSPGSTGIPMTRVTPTGFPVPFALPPDQYVFTAHASQSTALRACIVLTSA